MEKRGLILLFAFLIIALLISPPILAQDEDTTPEETTSNLETAFDCIKNKVAEDCSTLTSEQQAFAILALGNYKDCETAFTTNSQLSLDDTQQCWPTGACKLKDTAITLLAYDRLNKDTTKIEAWLLAQTRITPDLIWFLEIDADEATTCTVSYGTPTPTPYTIQIAEDKKIIGTLGDCLSLSEGDYWLQIESDALGKCLEYEYTIKCDKDFKTTLLYKTQSSDTIHVSSILNSAVASGTTTEQITYKCFKQGTICNYEGSLWATMVLNSKTYDMDDFWPYLTANVEDKPQFFPEAFLEVLTGDYFSDVVDKFTVNYWTVAGSAYSKEYNTALAFLALGQQGERVDAAKEYFETAEGIQNADGCFNNIRDTGFLLYTGWDLINPPDPDPTPNCEPSGYCMRTWECTDTGGLTLDNLDCSGSDDICCDTDIVYQTCSAQNGVLCNPDETCEGGDWVSSSDDKDCCKEGICQTSTETVCAQQDYTCDVECLPSEEIVEYACNSGYVCCKPKLDPSSVCGNNIKEEGEECDDGNTADGDNCSSSCQNEGGGNWWWILILLILIIIVIIAIIFRNKIRLFLFKRKGRFKKGPGPGPTGPPRFPPPPGMMPPPQQRPRPVFHRPPPRRRPPGMVSRNKGAPAKESQFKDTLDKLKKMSQ